MSDARDFDPTLDHGPAYAICPEDPRRLFGQPIGMYHCPECGCMVLAGLEHAPHDEGCWLGLEDTGPNEISEREWQVFCEAAQRAHRSRT